MLVKTNLKGKIALYTSIGAIAIIFIIFIVNIYNDNYEKIYNDNYEKNREETLQVLVEPPSADFDAATIEDADYKYKDLKEKAESYLKKVERYDEEPFKENAVKWRVYLNDMQQSYKYTREKILVSSLETPPSSYIYVDTVAELLETHRQKMNKANEEISKVKGMIEKYGNISDLSNNLDSWIGFKNKLLDTVYDCPQHDLTCKNCKTMDGKITCPRCNGNYSGYEGFIPPFSFDNCDNCDDPDEQYNYTPGTNRCRNHMPYSECPYCNTKNGKLRITY